MAEQGTTPGEQLVVRHIADRDGDWLVEVGEDNPRRWQSVVEEMTLSLSSVRGLFGRAFRKREPLEGGETSAVVDSLPSLTVDGVSKDTGCTGVAYGIDVSEGDPDHLIAQRVDEAIGIDLISRSPEAFYENGLRVPYASEVFVCTDGWYYGDAESVRLLFDIPEADLWGLYDNLRGGDAEKLDLTVSLRRWMPTETNTRQQDSERPVTPIVYGYGGHARLKEWTVVSRFL